MLLIPNQKSWKEWATQKWLTRNRTNMSEKKRMQKLQAKQISILFPWKSFTMWYFPFSALRLHYTSLFLLVCLFFSTPFCERVCVCRAKNVVLPLWFTVVWAIYSVFVCYEMRSLYFYCTEQSRFHFVSLYIYIVHFLCLCWFPCVARANTRSCLFMFGRACDFIHLMGTQFHFSCFLYSCFHLFISDECQNECCSPSPAYISPYSDIRIRPENNTLCNLQPKRCLYIIIHFFLFFFLYF